MIRKMPKWMAGVALVLAVGTAPLACDGGGDDQDMGGAPNDEDGTGGKGSSTGGNGSSTGGKGSGVEGLDLFGTVRLERQVDAADIVAGAVDPELVDGEVVGAALYLQPQRLQRAGVEAATGFQVFHPQVEVVDQAASVELHRGFSSCCGWGRMRRAEAGFQRRG